MTPLETLKRYFGYDSFRPGQEEIVSALLAGRDALAIMPTGAGKSLCYQVPALLLPGLTLVISPLISLMQDQVKGLNAAGIHAAFINSSLTETQIARALDLAAEGSYKLVYVAPERLESPVFRSFAAGADISMVTVDEAHCISQWGQDFRPSYLKILDFIDSLPRRPIVSAFTATATREVKDDIVCTLRLHDPKVLVTGFDRPNLYFQVERTRRKDDFVIQYLRDHPGESGIIYCATRKNVDKLQELLTEYGLRPQSTTRACPPKHAAKIRMTSSTTPRRSLWRRTPLAWALTSPTCGSCCTTTCPRAWRIITRRRAVPGVTGCRRSACCFFRRRTSSSTNSCWTKRILPRWTTRRRPFAPARPAALADDGALLPDDGVPAQLHSGLFRRASYRAVRQLRQLQQRF